MHNQDRAISPLSNSPASPIESAHWIPRPPPIGLRSVRSNYCFSNCIPPPPTAAQVAALDCCGPERILCRRKRTRSPLPRTHFESSDPIHLPCFDYRLPHHPHRSAPTQNPYSATPA